MDPPNSGCLDQNRLEELYVRLEKPIYNVVYRWVWNREEAQDTVQEAFTRLWKIRRRVRLETVEPLLYRIAVNLAANRRRAGKVRRWIALESLGEAVSERNNGAEQIELRERVRAVRRAVDSLPEKLRRVVLLCEFSELTYEQIGHSLGIPPGTVGSRRNAALALLEKRLGAFVEENHGR